MEIGFDVISDLHLLPEEPINWHGKATSLFCIVAGNISDHLKTIHQTLWHLSQFYQGIFYIGGALEYSGAPIHERTNDLTKICNQVRNVTYLHHHVVIIDGVAILGATGWYGQSEATEAVADCNYLSQSISKLQLHRDVKRIVLVSNTVPDATFYFGSNIEATPSLSYCLENDTEKKVRHWVYGQENTNTEMTTNKVNYVNNSAYGKSPYWAKRILVTF